MGEGSTNDDCLTKFTRKGYHVSMRSKEKRHLRMQSIYLKKVYELALQYMNNKTWRECCKMCIDILSGNDVNYIKSDQIIMKWNRKFKVKDPLC